MTARVKANRTNSLVLINAEGIDVAAAAGLPVAFGTAHLALTERARLQAGQVLLVLGAGGGVGVAAVQVQGRAACTQCAASCIAADIPSRPYPRQLTACVLHVGRWAAASVTVSWRCMQIGKLLGAKVVAVARGPEKCALLSQLGADLVVDSVLDSLFQWPSVSYAQLHGSSLLHAQQLACTFYLDRLCKQHVWPSCSYLYGPHSAVEGPNDALHHMLCRGQSASHCGNASSQSLRKVLTVVGCLGVPCNVSCACPNLVHACGVPTRSLYCCRGGCRAGYGWRRRL